MVADFSGYATKNDLKCSDGRTIRSGAFKHADKQRVPLVWQHMHNSPDNILGHAILEHRQDGVYAYGYFNDTPAGQNARTLVKHGDVEALSIYANNLSQRGSDVLHGDIKEVSLVLSGANPGAMIDNVNIRHGDTVETLDSEVVIYTGLSLEHAENTGEKQMATPTKDDEKTVKEVFDTLTEEQQTVVYYMIGAALDSEKEGADAQHSDLVELDVEELSEHVTKNIIQHFQEDPNMTRNLFETAQGDTATTRRATLSHSQIQTIVNDAQKMGSFKDSLLAHADEYGITDIDFLFPDAKTVTSQPELISRRTEWVKGVIDGAKHSPFARIKSLAADLTADEARAKGYVKGNLKKDEIIKLLKRVTTPTTVYKKQKLDRDDIVDITDFDVVAWLKWEMRFMLEEELARAILIGDGREPDDEDKIDEEKLRPIAWDHEMYAHPVNVPAETSPEDTIESILRARKHYKGTGTPTLYTTDDILTDMLLVKDKMRRRIYMTVAELAQALRVKEIVVVEVMENTPDLLGIIVNIADYTVGADRGGALAMFDDFDIDYNQQKYLIETRISGALTKPKSAIVIKRISGTTVTPTAPAYNPTTKVLTIPNITGVEYWDVTDLDNETKFTAGNVTLTETTDVEARPATGYNFPHNTDADWTYAVTGA